MKISLFEMAEAIGGVASSARADVERWDRDHDDPLPPNDQWVVRARTLETAHLTLSLMALDEDASRKFVSSIIAAKGSEAQMLMSMLNPAASKSKTVEIEAA